MISSKSWSSHPLLAGMLAVPLLCLIAPFFLGREAATSRAAGEGALGARAGITVSAAGRGHPWIIYQDGRDLIADYNGPAQIKARLDRGLLVPAAMSTGDFDEDGIPDLVCAHISPSGGVLTLRRGNADSIFPNPSAESRRDGSEEETEPSAFLSPARVFSLTQPPDYVAAGDFDGDGHCDVVAAPRAGRTLSLLAGNGQGGFGIVRPIELPGSVTALAAGEINRCDGQPDLFVGVVRPEGAAVLVYESPEGALQSPPELFRMKDQVAALAAGRLDDDATMDLAVAAGRDLVILHGRDRGLSLDEPKRTQVPPAAISRFRFSFAIHSIALGDFIPNGRPHTAIALMGDDGVVRFVERGDLAVGERKRLARASDDASLPWRVFSAVGVLPAQDSRWKRLPGLLIRTKVSSLQTDDLVVLDPTERRIHLITSSPAGARAELNAPLRYAIAASLDVRGEPVALLPMRLNLDALSDLVILYAGGSAPAVAMTAVAMTFQVTSPGDNGVGTLRDAMNLANANPGSDLIVFNLGMGTPTIQVGTVVGIDLPTITEAVSINGNTGGATRVELNGAAAAAASNVVFGIGGINVGASGCAVRNLVINRFPGDGIEIRGASNLIEGSFIGTDAGGTAARLNSSTGVIIGNSPNNVIGGTAAAARNLISGNNKGGVSIQGALATGNMVQGNLIGSDITGNIGLGNLEANVSISGSNNTIGGTTGGARNLISASMGGDNVFLAMNATGNLVQGNLIGTNAAGTGVLGGERHGVLIQGPASGNTVGGTVATARNVISGNSVRGVAIEMGSSANQVQGNLIGTNITGTGALANTAGGVGIDSSANNTVGGASAAARNVISGNLGTGVSINGMSANANQVLGNLIGTRADGASPLSNGTHGIFLDQAGNGNTIGGTVGGGNLIAFNGGNGVRLHLVTGIQNAIRGNSIVSNSSIGISLGSIGVTANDPGDGDNGPNRLQNFPVLTSVCISGANMTIQGSLDTNVGNATYPITLEFFISTACDPSGNGEGQTFLGSSVINAPGTFTANLPAGTGRLTATATDSAGNTSEFSACVSTADTTPPVINCPGNIAVSADSSNGLPVNFNVTATDNCDPSPIITCAPASGSTFPGGVTMVTCRARDRSGNQGTCVFMVTVDVPREGTPILVSPADGGTVTNPRTGASIEIPPDTLKENVLVSVLTLDSPDQILRIDPACGVPIQPGESFPDVPGFVRATEVTRFEGHPCRAIIFGPGARITMQLRRSLFPMGMPIGSQLRLFELARIQGRLVFLDTGMDAKVTGPGRSPSSGDFVIVPDVQVFSTFAVFQQQSQSATVSRGGSPEISLDDEERSAQQPGGRRLYFPVVNQRGGRQTRISIANPESSAALTVKFTAYAVPGDVFGTQSRTVPAGRQASYLVSDLFAGFAGGSIVAEALSGAMTGSFEVADSFLAPSMIGSAEAVAAAQSSLVFPVVKSVNGGFTEIGLFNPNPSPATIRLAGFGASGMRVSPTDSAGQALNMIPLAPFATLVLSSAGPLPGAGVRMDFSGLDGGAVVAGVLGGPLITGGEVFGEVIGGQSTLAVLNGLSFPTGCLPATVDPCVCHVDSSPASPIPSVVRQHTAYATHFENLPTQPIMYLVNVSDLPAPVAVSAFSSQGEFRGSFPKSDFMTLGPHEVLQISLQEVLGFHPGSGYVRLEDPNSSIVGSVAQRNSAGGRYFAAAPLVADRPALTQAPTTTFFSRIQIDPDSATPPSRTGIAIFNPNPHALDFVISLIDNGGVSHTSTEFTIQGRGTFVRARASLSIIFPGVTGGFAQVQVRTLVGPGMGGRIIPIAIYRANNTLSLTPQQDKQP